MNLPFTIAQFFDVFGAYNEAVWPAQIALIALAIAAAAGVLRGTRRSVSFAFVILSVLWTWMAVVYHIGVFATINPAAWLFAALFAIEAIGLALFAAFPQPAREPAAAGRMIAILLSTYALAGYPAIAYASGQRYPRMPTFGVPCPTTIFTFAMFCAIASSVPLLLLIIPLLWSVVATYAATGLNVPEDFGLPVAAAITVALCVGSRLAPAAITSSVARGGGVRDRAAPAAPYGRSGS